MTADLPSTHTQTRPTPSRQLGRHGRVGRVVVLPEGRAGMTQALFALPVDAVEVTSDDCYTPRWVFDAMGLRFDIDVAAPPGGPWHVPCDRYFTAADDGLAQPWVGLVWCNPPYSNFAPWAEKFARHRRAVLMGYLLPEVRWFPTAANAAEAVAIISCDFTRATGQRYRLRQPVFVAFRGVGTEPAERLAAADPFGAVLYGRAGVSLSSLS